MERPPGEGPGPHLWPCLSLGSSHSSPGFPSGLAVKKSACQHRRRRFDPWVGEIPPEKEKTTHSSILAWRIPWTEEPGGLQSMGLQELHTTERLNNSHCFPCQHHSVVPSALRLAFKILSHLASLCVLFPRPLPVLFLLLRMYSLVPTPTFCILANHQINTTSPKKSPQSLPGKKLSFWCWNER